MPYYRFLSMEFALNKLAPLGLEGLWKFNVSYGLFPYSSLYIIYISFFNSFNSFLLSFPLSFIIYLFIFYGAGYVIVMVLVVAFQSTLQPKFSATNLNGSIVLLFTIIGFTS